MQKKTRKTWFLSGLAWCLGVLGMIGIWLGVSVWLDRPCLWMSVLTVLDIALILRFMGVQPGKLHFLGILVGSILVLLGSQWLIAANAFGLVMGLFPLEAARMVGPVLVWEFTRLRLGEYDWIWLLISLVSTAWYGLRKQHTLT